MSRVSVSDIRSHGGNRDSRHGGSHDNRDSRTRVSEHQQELQMSLQRELPKSVIVICTKHGEEANVSCFINTCEATTRRVGKGKCLISSPSWRLAAWTHQQSLWTSCAGMLVRRRRYRSYDVSTQSLRLTYRIRGMPCCNPSAESIARMQPKPISDA